MPEKDKRPEAPDKFQLKPGDIEWTVTPEQAKKVKKRRIRDLLKRKKK